MKRNKILCGFGGHFELCLPFLIQWSQKTTTSIFFYLTDQPIEKTWLAEIYTKISRKLHNSVYY